ncbi:hypothetical protein BGX23_012540 [Mortierella sp. AD031]|nr:hypothetical protein BGX23_012540 [Mortierella sp. AD031]
MRTKHTLLVLSLSVAALITAAPIKSLPDNEQPLESQTAFAFLEHEGSFEAFATPPPTSFLIEFNLSPAGVNRHERMRLEETDEFQGFTASRQATVANQHQNFQEFMSDQLKVDFAVRHDFFDFMNGLSTISKTFLPTICLRSLSRSNPCLMSLAYRLL